MSDTMDNDTSSVDWSAIASGALDKIVAADAADAADGAVATPEPGVPLSAPEATAPAPVADTPAAAEAEAAADLYDDDKVQQFDREYVTKLREKEDRYRRERNEARERWAEWDKTLDGLDLDQQGLARELVASILQGDLERAAEIIGRDQLAEVLGAAQAAPAATAEPAPGEAPLTRADLEREFAEREKAREAQQQMDAVLSQAKGLGYNPDAKPGSPDFGRWVMVVQYAQANGGNLEAGHKALEAAEQAERQRIIDEFVSSRSNGSPAPAAGSGAAAREPADAWLEQAGNPLELAKRRALQRANEDHAQVR